MSTGRFSTYQITGWIDDMYAAAKWLSVVSADPHATSSPLTTEIVGEGLTRQASSWTRTGAGLLTLDTAVVFAGLPAGAHVTGVAGFDAATNGNLLFADLLEQPVGFPFGGTYTLPAGEYVIGIDLPGVS